MDEFEATPTLEGLQAAFGITAEPPSTPDNGGETTTPAEDTSGTPAENATEEKPPAEGGSTSTPEPATTSAEPQQPQQQTQQQSQEQQTPSPAQQFQQNRQQQANQAFAKMRTENAAMLKSLQTTAQILGINPNLPPDQLSAQIQKQANAAIAKQNNMDPAILNRLNELEAINAKYVQAEKEKQIMQSLEAIRTKFGATDDDLTVFVETLDSEGVDPYADNFDLITEFVKRNFDTILKNKIDAAVQAEQQRASKAGGASQPSKKQGQEDNTEPKEVTSQSEFDQFMDSLIN